MACSRPRPRGAISSEALAAYDRALAIETPFEEGAVPELPIGLIRKRARAAEAAEGR